MEAFTTLRGPAAPLMRANIDTGTMIASVWMRSTSFDLGEKLFHDWRYDLDGKENPAFVLNQSRFRNSRILVAGPFFGCGSSREGAVWALQKFGIRCVIAPSFGEIFFDNALQNGLLLVTLSDDETRRLATSLEAAQEPLVEVDLINCVVEGPDGARYGFEIPPDRRTVLLEGLDETSLILRYQPEIRAFQMKSSEAFPWIYARPSQGAENETRPAGQATP